MTPSRPFPLLLPLLSTLFTFHFSLFTSAAAPGAAVEIVAPESGPPVVSLLHELEHALDLADRWLKALPPDLRTAALPLPPPLDIPPETLYPLFDAFTTLPTAPDGTPLTFPQAADALAAALDQTASQWIYLPDGTPVEWRKELLHAILVRQRIDPKTSGGHWTDPADPSPPATLRATLLSLRAISSLTHLPVPSP